MSAVCGYEIRAHLPEQNHRDSALEAVESVEWAPISEALTMTVVGDASMIYVIIYLYMAEGRMQVRAPSYNMNL